jgi:hypothetical protein
VTPEELTDAIKRKRASYWLEHEKWPTIMIVSPANWLAFIDWRITSMSMSMLMSTTDAAKLRVEGMDVHFANIGDEVFVGEMK